MCGRAVQTAGAVMAASTLLSENNACQERGSVIDNIGPRISRRDNSAPIVGGTASHSYPKDSSNTRDEAMNGSEKLPDGTYPWRDNFNLSPGHDAVVFTLDKNGQLTMDRKVWGLVPKGGTNKSPLPEGPSKHYANLMFNARSDTLFSKPTFGKLLNEYKTCLCAVDGFYEWKTDPMGGGKRKKQPYYIFRKQGNASTQQQTSQNRPYLLMAGLWTSVPTGYSSPKPSTLDTFTIITTEVCEPLRWLHSRMPVCVWNEDLAWKWLREPSRVFEQMDNEAQQTKEHLLQWHAVSSQMNSTKYRSADAINALKQPTSVKSFFAPVVIKSKKENAPGLTPDPKKRNAKNESEAKERSSSLVSPSSGKRSAPIHSPEKQHPAFYTNKRAKPTPDVVKKKGSITSFFAPTQPKETKGKHS